MPELQKVSYLQFSNWGPLSHHVPRSHNLYIMSICPHYFQYFILIHYFKLLLLLNTLFYSFIAFTYSTQLYNDLLPTITLTCDQEVRTPLCDGPVPKYDPFYVKLLLCYEALNNSSLLSELVIWVTESKNRRFFCQ